MQKELLCCRPSPGKICPLHPPSPAQRFGGSMRRVTEFLRSEINGNERLSRLKPEPEKAVKLHHTTLWRWEQKAGRKVQHDLKPDFGEASPILAGQAWWCSASRCLSIGLVMLSATSACVCKGSKKRSKLSSAMGPVGIRRSSLRCYVRPVSNAAFSIYGATFYRASDSTGARQVGLDAKSVKESIATQGVVRWKWLELTSRVLIGWM